MENVARLNAIIGIYLIPIAGLILTGIAWLISKCIAGIKNWICRNKLKSTK